MRAFRFVNFFLSAIFLCFYFIACTQNDQETNEYKQDVSVINEKKIIVVVGSSTAEGAKASCMDSSWTGRLSKFIQSKQSESQVINLAKSGYTTYHLLPKSFNRLQNRPHSDTLRNIECALKYKPTHVIINLPSNDAAYKYSNEEQLANFKVLMDFFSAEKIQVYLCSPQPRNFKTFEVRKNQWDLFLQLQILYPSVYIDFWNDFSSKDLTLLDKYNSGDGIHMNDLGHRLMFERVKFFFE